MNYNKRVYVNVNEIQKIRWNPLSMHATPSSMPLHHACHSIIHATPSCMPLHHACHSIMHATPSHATPSCMPLHHACHSIMHATPSCMPLHHPCTIRICSLDADLQDTCVIWVLCTELFFINSWLRICCLRLIVIFVFKTPVSICRWFKWH